MGTVVMPSGMASPNWSRLPSRIRRGVPCWMTCLASRITTGSAQAPPIQPCSSPSAVMIARELGWLEDGPCRQTTVASANASPWLVSSVICSKTLMSVPLDRRGTGDVAPVFNRVPDPVRQQRHVDVADSRVTDGVHDRVHEGGRAADRGALADALGADRVVRAGGDDLAVQLEARRLPRGRQQVVHVVRAHAVAVGVERDELHAG